LPPLNDILENGKQNVCCQHKNHDRTRQAWREALHRGLRITVWDVLGWLGAGMTEAEILHEHLDLEKADFPAVYQFAADVGRKANLG
jgi:hypothetical protein